MAAATYNLTTVLKRNLHVTPRGLEQVRMSVPIFIDTTITELILAAASYKILTIEAQTLVLGGFQIVQTVEVAADTIAVGDVTTFNRWLAATAVNALGETVWTGAGNYYAAADEVQITASAAITACKFWEIVDLQYLVTT